MRSASRRIKPCRTLSRGNSCYAKLAITASRCFLEPWKAAPDRGDETAPPRARAFTREIALCSDNVAVRGNYRADAFVGVDRACIRINSQACGGSRLAIAPASLPNEAGTWLNEEIKRRFRNLSHASVDRRVWTDMNERGRECTRMRAIMGAHVNATTTTTTPS